MDDLLQSINFSSIKSTPVILQTEMSECALACLAMVAGRYGFKMTLSELRRNYSISTRGATLRQVIEIANKLKLSSRAIRLDLEELNKLKCPAILHWSLNHYVVLEKVTKSYAIILDPARGRRKVYTKELSENFTGVALELFPSEDFEKKEKVETIKLSQFWSSMVGIKSVLFKILLLSMLLQIMALAGPFYMQTIVDEVVISNDISLLYLVTAGFVLLFLIEMFVNTLRAYIIMYLSSQLNIQMSGNLLNHLLKLPLSFFEKRHMGDVLSRFGSLSAVRNLLTGTVIASILDGIMAITTFILMYIYNPFLASVTLGVVVFYLITRLIMYPHFKALNEEQIHAAAEENTNFMENIRAIQCVKTFALENRRVGIWKNKAVDNINVGIRIGRLSIVYGNFNSLLFGILNFAVIFISVKEVMAGTMTLGMLFAFLAYKSNCVGRMTALVESYISYKLVVGLHLERLSDIVGTETEKGLTSTRELNKEEFFGCIELKNITFNYDGSNNNTLDNISLKVKAGESVALIGSSGCGKTTLLKIMMGLLEPVDGEVLVDQQRILDLGLENYRQLISAVMQEDRLLAGTIADNITLFDEFAKRENIELMAQLACLKDDVNEMPMGYDSLVGDMGSALSGGQKQRLFLARALYKKPKILFLDEATSHLDTNTESVVNNSVKMLDITRVIVAHRPETIMSCDRIFEFSHGKIKELAPQIYRDNYSKSV